MPLPIAILNYMKVCLNKMRNIIKLVYIWCLKIIQKMKWRVQYSQAKHQKLYPSQLTRLKLDKDEKIVVLVPHADDEWIGPYSIIKDRPSKLHCVYFNLFGNDYSEKNIQIRDSEIKASSDYWGFKLVNNYNYDVEALCKELEVANKCFVPSPYDWHNEHREVFKTFVKAYSLLTESEKSKLEIYYFCVSLPHSYKESQYYVPLTKKNLFDKWQVFPRIYHSQSFMPALRYKLQLKLVPSEIGYAAQTFIKASVDMLMKDYKLVSNSCVCRKLGGLQNHMNNIVDSRKMVEQVKREIKNENN